MRKPYPTDLTDEQWDLVAPSSRRPGAGGSSTSARS